MIHFIKTESSTPYNLFNISSDFEYPISSYLIQNVQWNKIFSILCSFKEEYNDLSGRFFKSDIISHAFEHFSDGKIKYVDEIGCDFYLPELNVRVEGKSGLKIFQKKSTVDIKLKNFNGYATEFEKTFDYLLLVEPQMIGVISYEKVQSKIYKKNDGIYCKLSNNDIEIIRNLNAVKVSEKNLTDIRKDCILKCIKEVEGLYENESI